MLRILLAVAIVWGSGDFVRGADIDRSDTVYGRVLAAFVKDGLVDYAGLKASPADLVAYLDAAAGVGKETFQGWTRDDQLAFLCNVYNAATLKLIVDYYPVTSIRKIGGWLSGPWKQKVVRLWGNTITLDELEHGIIRGEFAEPRIHFALVCAARGCPPLRGEPFTGARLRDQLNDQARRFLAETAKNRVDVPGKTLYLSPIFKWYGGDFEKDGASVVDFVARHLPPESAAAVRSGGYRIRYTEYDWALNEARGGHRSVDAPIGAGR